MPIQNRITQVGIAKQNAKGAAAATAAYQLGVNSGAVTNAEVSEEDLPITWASRLIQGHDRTAVYPGADFETLALPQSIGTLLQAACGQDAVTGSGPYVHTFKHALSLPYLSLFARKDAEYFKVSDARVNELEFSWEQTGALRVKVVMGGCTYEFLGAPYTADADERPQAGVFKGCGGSFTVNGTSAIVRSGSIKVSNGIEPIYGSDSVLPKDVFPQVQTVDVSLTIVPDNLQEFRRTLTGAPAGSAVVCNPTYGAVSAQWRVDPDTHLTFESSRLKTVVGFPETNAQGGPVELTLEGSVAEPAVGDAYTFVLSNDVAAAY